MAQGNENKVKFGLTNVYYAEILSWTEKNDVLEPTYKTPVRIPGAVSLSLDASGGSEPFYADNTTYYVTSTNSGYEGDLEIAKIIQSFAIDILGEKLDNKGVLVESKDVETKEFALLFEFDGDKHKVRHVLYRCTATRPSVSGQTTEESKTPQTDTLSLTVAPLPSGLVKSKTVNSTDDDTYKNWFSAVYLPDFSEI